MIGTTLGGVYEVLRLVGSGAFGDVHLGRDVRSNTVVALKCLHARFAADPVVIERFRRDALIARAVADPHVVRVFDVGRHDGTYYIVMEYVQGFTLAHHLRQAGSLSVRASVGCIDQVLQALAAAHRAGVVHRDVKPQNVMITPDGVIKVADFGVAKHAAAATLTRPGELLGTPAYMSPEQSDADRPEEVDSRSDLYAAGVMLFEMVSGRVPFDAGNSLATLYQHRYEPIPSVRSFKPDLPIELDRLLHRSLAKRSDQRFQTADEMRAALRTLPGIARPPRGNAAPAVARPPADDAPHPAKAPSSQDPPSEVWGSEGRSRGQFRFPTGLAVDRAGNLYVADRGNNRIHKLAPTGQPLDVWGSVGIDAGEFIEPAGVAVDERGNIYVTERVNHRVQVLTATGQPVTAWGSEGQDPGQFKQPIGVAVDFEGNVYVADAGNHRVQKLSPAGVPLAQWGSQGGRPGQFYHPIGVEVDGQGYVYVTDRMNGRVQKLAATGQVVASWRSSRIFDRPGGLAVDADGCVYVADAGEYQLHKLSPSGDLLRSWGPKGSDLGHLDYPAGVAIDSAGHLYVSEVMNHRIQRFSVAALPPDPRRMP